MKLRVNLGKGIFTLSSTFRKVNNVETIGYCNRCSDGRYIVFLDYDNLEQSWVEEELKHLQYMFFLNDFYLFKSGVNNYHAVCFDKLTLSEYIEVLRNSSVDINYINVPLYFGKKIWTLRMTEKNDKDIKFIKVISSKLKHYNQSSPHADFISKMFKIKVKLFMPDFNKKLLFARYRT